MQLFRLKDMFRGWFIGDFRPSILRTRQFEIAVKKYKRGAAEERHFHQIVQEITVVASGKIKMCDRVFTAGDIVVLEPGEATDFRALTDTINVVIKIPSVPNDKIIDPPKKNLREKT